MLGTFGKSQAQLQALDRIRDWTRERFALAADDVLLVTEVACAVPGCPPLETVVAFWTGGNRRHHFKVFKPAAQVEPADLPYAWMKEGLVVADGFSCDCC
jgi:hypothetical protein